ncbi:MAG: ABC transporter substrate-binding protein [bacterium]|nr:ABC transporter substrate-binding protein [bacterium]
MALLSDLLFNSGLNKNRNNSYIPDIIENVEFSGNSYKITLNRNVAFWDGTEVTSSIFKEDLLNKKFFTSDEIQVQNRYTLIISPKRLQIYTYDFLCTKLIKMPAPASPQAFLTNNYQGTGPFTVKEFNENRIILIKNSKYFKGKPKVDEIGLLFYKSYYDEFSALMRGEIDLIYLAGNSQVKWLRENSDFKIIDISFPFFITLRFNFNSAYPLSLEQRKFLKHLFSQDELKSVFNDYYSKPAVGPLSSDSEIYRKYLSGNLNSSCSEIDVNEMPELNMLYFEDLPILKKMAFYIQDKFIRLGIKTVIHPGKYSEFNSIDFSKYNIILCTLKSDVNISYYHYIYSDRSPQNFIGYSNPEVEKIILLSFVEYDPEKRRELEEMLYLELMKEVPEIFLFYPKELYIISSKVNLNCSTEEIFNNSHLWEKYK